MSSAPLSEVNSVPLAFPPNHPEEAVSHCKELVNNLLKSLKGFNHLKGEIEIFYMGFNERSVKQLQFISEAYLHLSSRYHLLCLEALPYLRSNQEIEDLTKSINRMEAVRYQEEIKKKSLPPKDAQDEAEEESAQEKAAAKPLFDHERTLMNEWNHQKSQRCKMTVSLISQAVQAVYHRSQKAADALDFLHKLSKGEALKHYGCWVTPPQTTSRLSAEATYPLETLGIRETPPLKATLTIDLTDEYSTTKLRLQNLVGLFNRIKGEAELAALTFGSAEEIDKEELDKHLKEVWTFYQQQYEKSCDKPEELIKTYLEMVQYMEKEIATAAPETKSKLTAELAWLKEIARTLSVRSHRTLFIINGLAIGRCNITGKVRIALQPEGMLQRTFYLLDYYLHMNAAKFSSQLFSEMEKSQST